MGVHAKGNYSEDADPVPAGRGKVAPASIHARTLKLESQRFEVGELTLALQHLLDLGPGANPEAMRRVTSLVARLKKALPESHFREERLRDLATDFSLWFSKGPRLQFDYNDEALRSMLQVDIHRLKTG